MKNKGWSAVGCAGVLGLMGCTGPAETVRTGAGPQLLAESAMMMVFNEEGLRSEGVEIQREDSGLSGMAAGQPVSMKWEGSSVQGTYRSLPVELEVTSTGGSTVAMGELDGEGASFRLAPELVEGYVSKCAFRLERQQDGAFAGARSCGAEEPEPMVMALPARLWDREPAERAAWLGLVLSEFGNKGEKVRSVARPTVVMSTDRSPKVLRKCGLRGFN